MSPFKRRGVLAATAGTAIALSGCLSSVSGQTDTPIQDGGPLTLSIEGAGPGEPISLLLESGEMSLDRELQPGDEIEIGESEDDDDDEDEEEDDDIDDEDDDEDDLDDEEEDDDDDDEDEADDEEDDDDELDDEDEDDEDDDEDDVENPMVASSDEFEFSAEYDEEIEVELELTIDEAAFELELEQEDWQLTTLEMAITSDDEIRTLDGAVEVDLPDSSTVLALTDERTNDAQTYEVSIEVEDDEAEIDFEVGNDD